jgi:cyclase
VVRSSLLLSACFAALSPVSSLAQIDTVQNLAPDVYFHEGDPRLGTCNNGWVVMADYVVGVDANYPVGAKVVIPKIRAMTDKPIRFVIDTHFHPDHSFGNQVWAEAGAVPVAQVATLEELQRTGASRWAESARTRPDVAASSLKLPGLVYSDSMAFDDGVHRVELHFFGVGHTHGDTLVWLPHERILFTGDVCVNGSFNYLHDSNVPEWIKLLERAKQLGALKVCPGHGPMGGPEIIANQQEYFIRLTGGIQALIDEKKTLAEVKAAAPALAAQMRKIAQIRRYVPSDFWFGAQVEDVTAQMKAGRP